MRAPLYGNSPAESILEYVVVEVAIAGGVKIDQLVSKAVGSVDEVPVASAGQVPRSATFDEVMGYAGLEATPASRETFRKRLAVYSPELPTVRSILSSFLRHNRSSHADSSDVQAIARTVQQDTSYLA